MLEVNLIRMTRKYQALEEQEQLLRRNYRNVEQEMSEMEVGCLQRINQLKEWKRNATYQLKQLYEQLRVAVPLAENEGVTKELELLKQKFGDLIVRDREHASELSRLQTELRAATETAAAQRELVSEKEDLEREFNAVRRRLEALDPKYRWENQLYHRIVKTLERSRYTVTQAFELFDADHDGQLSRVEFIEALAKCGVSDLAAKDVELLMISMDSDGDGRVQYKEFSRKLQRCGLRTLSAQEARVHTIIKALRRLDMPRSDLFRFLHKEGEGLLTRQDFRDTLGRLGMQEVGDEDVENFIEYFYKDEKGGIDLTSFLRIFERYERHVDQEENPGAGQARRRRGGPTSRKVLTLKKRIFEQLHQALKQAGATLRTYFQKLDRDGSRRIDLAELRDAFRQMGLDDLLTEKEFEEVFRSIDADASGAIDWAELQHDFDRCLAKGVPELEEEERLLHAEFEDPEPEGYGEGGEVAGLGSLQALEYQRKLASLDGKLKQAYLELRNEQALRKLTDESLALVQRHHDELRKQFDHTRDEFFKEQESVKRLEAQIRESIKKVEAEQIRRSNQALQLEVAETRAALLSYKSMHGVVCEQVKSLKVMHERGKDENESLVAALRDLQSETFDKQRFGKLYYVVMLSRWQEAAVNKKYAVKLAESKELAGELLDAQQLLENKERDHHAAEAEARKTKHGMLHLKQELQSCKNMFLTIQQG